MAHTTVDTRTPDGRAASFLVRDGTNDIMTVGAISQGDEYGLRYGGWSGWAIDVGSHIGTAAICLALDNPDLRVIAVEPVPDNADMVEQNAGRNGVADRVYVVRSPIGATWDISLPVSWGYRDFPADGPGYTGMHRFVGNQWRSLGDPEFSVDMPAVSLASLMDDYSIERVSLLKIDCEGCEFRVLADPEANARVHTITGEYHAGFTEDPASYHADPQADLLALLSASHTVRFLRPEERVVGLFRASPLSGPQVETVWA